MTCFVELCAKTCRVKPEMEGVSGRLVDNAQNMEDDYLDKRSASEFINDMSLPTAKLN